MSGHDAALDTIRELVGGDAAADRVVEYFTVVPGDRQTGDYTGAWFERLGGGGDRPDVADRFTADDIVAVTMLSVEVPPRPAKVILHEQSLELTALLRQIPASSTILTSEGRALLRDPVSPAHELWRRLEGLHGIGWVTANKLLARKRPHLLPVYDRDVRALLGNPNGFWSLCATTFEDEVLVTRLETVRRDAQVPHVSLLRILDVLLWREAKSRQTPMARSDG